jgi:hypothetical protein
MIKVYPNLGGYTIQNNTNQKPNEKMHQTKVLA